MNTWNRERKRTRDRLLDYDFTIIPPHPHSAGLNMIYPWENISLSQLSYQIFTLAKEHGFTGTENQLWLKFSNGNIITGTIATFPIPGQEDTLYFDIETGILYYFKMVNMPFNEEAVNEAHGIIINMPDNSQTYLYLPINALLIEDTILNCGSAAEYID